MSENLLDDGRGDTVPNTPEPRPDPDGIFARLKPINDAARQHFDYAVDAIKENPSLFAHARRNMSIEPPRQESVSAVSVFTDTEVVSSEGAAIDLPYRFKGEYLFQFSNPPRGQAWLLGDGRPSAAKQVDFLLTGPRRAAEIAGIHAMIFPHNRSCRLILRARHKTIVPSPISGGTTLTLSRSADSVEVELAFQNEIRIGGCVHLFQYDETAENQKHQAQLEAFMREKHGPNWEGLSNLLVWSPDTAPVRLYGYSWSLGAFAKGTFGQVTAGTRSDGTVVAVERLIKPDEERLSAHRKLMAHIGRHVSISSLVTEVN